MNGFFNEQMNELIIVFFWGTTWINELMNANGSNELMDSLMNK